MTCPVCKSEKANRPPIPCAVEMWTCQACGHEYAVHLHYLFQPGPNFPMSVLFSGTYTLPDPRDATKNYLKMKRLLHGCERYRQSNLERQFLDKKLVWKLGEFVEEEVERLLPECEKQGIAIEFRVYSDE